MHALSRDTMSACAAIVFRCNFCQDRHRYYSVGLKKHIPCPKCTRKPRSDSSGLRALIQQSDAQGQIARARALAAALDLAEKVASRARELDPARAPVDRVLTRWAAGEGDGPCTEEEMERVIQNAIEQPDTFTPPPAKPPVLDDETHIIVNSVVLHAPVAVKNLTVDWYLGYEPVCEIARTRGISRRQIYRHWHVALDYLREKFELNANETLIRLLRIPA